MRSTAACRFLVPFAAALLCALAPPAAGGAQAPASTPPAAATPAAPETVPQVLHRANELFRAGNLDEAAKEIERASALAGAPCGDCLLGLGTVRAAQGRWEESLDFTRRAIPLLTAPEGLARAHNQLGMALAQKPGDPEALKQAEAALQKSVEIGGTWGSVARYNLAQIYFLEKRWADAVRVAREHLDSVSPEDSTAKPARVVLCQARAALPDELPGEPAQIDSQIIRPVRIAGDSPQYNDEARKAGTEGDVLLACTVDGEGCVRQAKVVQGLPNGLSEAALEALRMWVYQPATRDGKPVPVAYTLSVKFQVDATAKPAQP